MMMARSSTFVQRRSETVAAEKLMRKRLKQHGYASEGIATYELRSHGVASASLCLSADHKHGLRQNNRAEVSHQPVRRHECKM